MKTTVNFSISTLLLFCIIFATNGCRKENIGDFCGVERVQGETVNNREGKVIYSEAYKRYAVDFFVAPITFDTQILGFPCELPAEFQVVGLSVVVTGNFKSFNQDEIIQPTLGGQELYFLEISKLEKK